MADGEEPAPSPPLPRADAFADVYDRMLDLADEHLPTPISATIDTWEDGEFRIKLYHHIPTDTEEVLYYHSAEQTVRYAIQDLEAETLTNERVVATIEPATGSKQSR